MIDLSPLLDGVVVPVLSAVLTAVAIWAIGRLASFAKFQVSEGQRKMVSDAIANGIAYARSKSPATVQVHNALVAEVVGYVLPKIPDTLKALGVTPDHLAELVEARLAGEGAAKPQGGG